VGMRRGRWKTVCARGADQAWSSGPSTSPLERTYEGQCVGFGLAFWARKS